jgi:hypothetical protein
MQKYVALHAVRRLYEAIPFNRIEPFDTPGDLYDCLTVRRRL